MENHYHTFNPDNHLQPEFDKITFNKLKGWELGWELLSAIDILEPGQDETELTKRFSPGQKCLYFFWYLDAQVTNGGFIQFYANGYHKYLAAILSGIDLINDQKLASLLKKADAEYLQNQRLFSNCDISEIYKKLPAYYRLDQLYNELHDNTMDLIEQYAKQNPEQFVRLI
ncbi:DUF4375 domain-containing protein [Mucilaginibacter litoreus]|uniref:DUF4375 domain-containing protein n=1 Tax=Mucilaginibacter litoreus TaxID=1048221 RepID=A0ABW3AM49_9SPHI